MHGARVAVNHLGSLEECENVRRLMGEFPAPEMGERRVTEVVGDVGDVGTRREGRQGMWKAGCVCGQRGGMPV